MDLIERSPDQWRGILIRCGVREDRADTHALAFADELQPGVLSGGEEELDDFLGQILHESGMLASLRENMRYSARRIREIGFAQKAGTRWRAAAERAEKLGADVLQDEGRALAEFLYGGRYGNGPEGSGDGWNYRGGAHIQATFQGTYARLSDWCQQDLLGVPDLMQQPHFGLQVSIAWWENTIPDVILGDLVKVTKRVQGGDFGIQHRGQVTAAARMALAAA